MQLTQPPRRLPPEPYIPLINIVFLLLIFFLIAARLTPAAPLPVTPPEAPGQAVAGQVALYLAADGRVAHGKAVGDAAFAALLQTRQQVCAAPCAVPPDLLLHVDARTPAAMLAQVMAQLGAAGWRDVQLITAVP